MLPNSSPMAMKSSPSKKQATPSGADSTDELRWQALVERDSSWDGRFFYGVRTTRIFCNPSCPSRIPRRENVSFFDSRKEAEAMGFRPCKRCQPGCGGLDGAHAATVAKACRIIEQADVPPRLGDLSRRVGMSAFHFHRVFKRLTGLTPKAYAMAHRAGQIRKELSGSRSVTEAIYEAGYLSNARFYEKSSEILGMRPRQFQRGGDGETIRFAVGECSLGSILVASSEQGICAISLGDDPDRLVRELQDLFPRATLEGGDRDFERLVAEVVGCVENPRRGWNLPLDIRGTAFQRQVWKALREIPPGRTVGYADVARSIGMPKASRAVAQACGANRLAVAIPCHRVVRTDGALSGYRWGVERKRALLESEAEA